MNRIVLLAFLALIGCNCEPIPSDNTGLIVVNGQTFHIKPDTPISISANSEGVQIIEHPKPVEKFSVKIVSIDFVFGYNKFFRVITCEYGDGRHYAKTSEPFKEVPYVGEQWLVHYDEQGEIVFDEIAR